MGNKNYTITKLFLPFLLFLSPLIAHSQPPERDVTLYTPYTSRSVTPGESVTYNIEIMNSTYDIQNLDLSVRSLPNSWEPSFTSGANTIQKIAVKPRTEKSSTTSQTVNLKLNVPLRIKKGTYRFTVTAEAENGRNYNLPLTMRVTEQGTFKTELQVDQANLEGYSDTDFTYHITLNNQTAEEQNYALRASAPRGWDVRFRAGSDYVTSVTVGSNETKNLTVKATPSQNASADTTKIDIRATAGSSTAEATLEAVVKGKYNLNLTTPSGRLSTEVTAGGEKDVELQLENTGTLPLHDIDLSSSEPTEWSVKFNQQKITVLQPGEKMNVTATINASNKAIAGDYRLEIDAEAPDASSNVTFRVTVNKSITWGSIGIGIILVVVGGIAYLFKTYGRR